MKTMLAAFAATALIAVLADLGLDRYAGFSAEERQSAPSVRLD